MVLDKKLSYFRVVHHSFDPTYFRLNVRVQLGPSTLGASHLLRASPCLLP
jgi:hypothetical protein